MSYDIYLTDPVTREELQADRPHYLRGGMYAIGGTTRLWLNITYNYGQWYRKPYAFGEKGIRAIYGMTGKDSIPLLHRIISNMETVDEELPQEEIDERKNQGMGDYWIPTKANAIKPLYKLIELAKMRPDGIWEGD